MHPVARSFRPGQQGAQRFRCASEFQNQHCIALLPEQACIGNRIMEKGFLPSFPQLSLHAGDSPSSAVRTKRFSAMVGPTSGLQLTTTIMMILMSEQGCRRLPPSTVCRRYNEEEGNFVSVVRFMCLQPEELD
ncbi:hypothetical protein ZHAS_00003851 [Anopheles sinensis]|uniref:Uncharacterized protein n=1 Tax=Anopheles sinensis TaxID=74873 RepID=A0A084VFF8_ANOSI|nr:hypothetical protein ZHAS_00003851 [Anopheles sinensis]